MSVQALTWAYKQDITPTGMKFILVTLANYASEEGYCYPSQKTLGKLTGQSERAVRGHLARLEGQGYLRREARTRKDGGRTSDGFYLSWDPRQNMPEGVADPGRSSHVPRRDVPLAPATPAANTKEDDSKEETKEIPPNILRVREWDAKRREAKR